MLRMLRALTGVTVAKVAREFDFKCAVSNKDDFQQELTEFGFEYITGDKPVVAARDAKGLSTRWRSSPLKLQDLFLTQRLERWILGTKSEAVPDNSVNSVKVAVARTLKSW